jgi:hypothetical protein
MSISCNADPSSGLSMDREDGARSPEARLTNPGTISERRWEAGEAATIRDHQQERRAQWPSTFM